ncbi:MULTISPECIES: hypothetical protein [Actinomycetes]|uniref:hypothetical protein n=1 Tax=Actinomycetes TaxID=1760 RepID=UPI0004BF78BA|nr:MULTISPECIES: hypothetical protein [Actinomycetes]MCK0515957.1 hypothetical protein [Williamsia sp. DF01-3]
MGLGWADWIRFVLTPLVLGLIAAIVATRNAKKTPHERLKNLVDIHDKMPDGLDSSNVVEAAIARELVDFDRRVAADQKGFWAGTKERVAQVSSAGAVLLVTTAVAVAIVAFAILIEVSWLPVAGAILGSLFGVGVSTGIYFASRVERESLTLDRAAAHIIATFPRVGIQFLASRDVFYPEDVKSGIRDAAERLEAMGVFTSDGSAGFRVTPFGKKAIELSLSEVDRQFFANMADVKAEMEARENESGPEPSGQ